MILPKKVRAEGAEPLALALDLREPASADEVVKQTLDRHHRIDGLINVAGAVPQTDLFVMTDWEWNDGLALKFHGARRLTIRAWDALKSARGAVVLTSGASALAPKPALAAVATINAAIAALAKAFSERGITDGVQVNSVLPGPVMTDRRRSMLSRYAASHNLLLDEATPEIGFFGHQLMSARKSVVFTHEIYKCPPRAGHLAAVRATAS